MIDLLRQRLQQVSATNAVQEEQALKEMLQEVTLYALWRGGFFKIGAFQGGTSLRILHGLPRFSEALDFILLAPAPEFRWAHYFESLTEVLAQFGVRCELSDSSRMDRAVRQAMLKDDSIGRQLDLSFFDANNQRKLKVKLEIDTRPPPGSGIAWHYLDFPLNFEVCAQDLPSNYALKLHALLCRPYLKGRDWFATPRSCLAPGRAMERPKHAGGRAMAGRRPKRKNQDHQLVTCRARRRSLSARHGTGQPDAMERKILCRQNRQAGASGFSKRVAKDRDS